MSRHSLKRYKYALISVSFITVLLVPQLFKSNVNAEVVQVSSSIASSCVSDNSNGGDNQWNNTSNALTLDGANAGSTVVGAGRTSYYLICTGFGFSLPTNASIEGIQLSLTRSASTAVSLFESRIRLVKNGVVQSHDKANVFASWPTTPAIKDFGNSTDKWGNVWSPTDIGASNFGVAIAASHPSSGSDTAFVDGMTITVWYNANARLAQQGYIWENDDEDQAGGDAYDSNSTQATFNNPITGVRKGERLTLRTQLKNISEATFDSELGLFYDKNGDGNFIKADMPEPLSASGNCGTGNAWICEQVQDTANSVNVGTYSSIAISPDGVPYVTYIDDGASDDLWVAFRIGQGGNCGSSNNWQCTAIETGTQITQTTSIAFSSQGVPWITYFDDTNDDLRVARFVGSGGSGCATTAWTCSDIEDNNVGSYSQIVFGANDVAYVAYHHIGNASVRIAQYVGSGGSGCSGSSDWTCVGFEAGQSGQYASMAIDTNGIIYIAWYDYTSFPAERDLRVGKYVGSGGNCVFSSAWQCTTVDSTGDTGLDTSIAISPDNIPYVTYYDLTNQNLRLAYFVSSGGDCTASSEWECVTLDANGSVGRNSSIAFSPGGVPYVSYNYATSNHTRLARYVGSGGNCNNGTYGGSVDAAAWECTDIDTSNGGDYTSIAFDSNGIAYVSYHGISNDDLRVARLARGGDISLALPSGGVHGDSLNTAKINGSCIGGGTYSNGKLFGTISGQTVQISSGNCTEVAFVVDTSQAEAGATYRFIIASADGHRADKGKWRGPSNISQYATFTIASDTDFKASKGVESQGGSCINSSWSCSDIFDTPILNRDVGQTSLAFSPSGIPYISYTLGTGADDLYIAQYVGSGGTGCATTAWTCTAIDTAASVSGKTSIAVSPGGIPYVTYHNMGSEKKIAQYVGSGGTGCATTAWTCTTLQSVNITAQFIAFSPNGIPYVVTTGDGANNLRINQYVGSGGTGCATTAWTCTIIVSDVSVWVQDPSLAFSQNGTPYITYRSGASPGNDLYVAQYVGSGGTGCGSGGHSAWTCTAIDVVSDVQRRPAIAFAPSGTPHISYKDHTGTNLRIAQYVGSGGTGCGAGGSTAWTCTIIDPIAVGASSSDTSIAFSHSGVPHVSYTAANNNLYIAKPSLYDTNPVFQSLFSNFNRSGHLGFGDFRLSNGQSPRSSTKGLCGSAVADYMGICALHDDGGHMESITAKQGERPYFNFSQRFDGNAILPTAAWAGRSNVAPSTGGNAGNIVLQVYRYGTTNAWETVATDSSSTNCNTQNCYLKGIPGGTISEYYQPDGGNYWIHWRIWQYENTSGTETLKTDLFQLQFINKQMRHGKLFENNLKRPNTF